MKPINHSELTHLAVTTHAGRVSLLILVALLMMSCVISIGNEAQPATAPVQANTQPPPPTQADTHGINQAPTNNASQATPAEPTIITVAPPTQAPPSLVVPTKVAPPQPATEAVPSGVLSDTGPWLVITTNHSLWAMNADGSGLTEMVTMAGEGVIVGVSPQPGGDKIAYLTFTDLECTHNARLEIMQLPQRRPDTITKLTNEKTEPGANAGPGDPATEAVRSMTQYPSLVWSPDGQTLAFIGAQDGNSSDLYTYTMADGKIHRLTTGPAHVYAPSWSPDGKYIVTYGVESFGTGAGYLMKGGWAALADGANVIDLPMPDSQGETVIGWTGPSTFVVYSWNVDGGGSKLRTYDIKTKKTSMLYKGSLTEAAMSTDAGYQEGNILFTGGLDNKGIYLIPAGQTQPQKLADDDASYVSYLKLPASVFSVYIYPKGLTTFSPDGSHREDGPPLKIYEDVAEYGAIWAWACSDTTNPGLWISGPGIDMHKIFDEVASAPAWSFDNTLIFFSKGDVYIAKFFDYVPQKVGQVTDEIWAINWLIPIG